MSPDDKDENGPSLALTFSERIEKSNINAISELNIGDQIRFNGTLVGLGDFSHLHHVHAFEVERGIGHNSDVVPYVHGTGRYSIKTHEDKDNI